MATTETSIQEVARLTGTTSRTLRHYDAIGLLRPSRVGHGGVRWYGRAELVRLQRILVLRALGLPLPAIADVVADGEDEVLALRRHLHQLRSEQERIGRQARSVERTIAALTGGGPVMAEEMFDGFDHTRYKDEVEQRWGARAYADSDVWWRGMSDDERASWQRTAGELGRDWAAAASAGAAPDSAEARDLARRHVAWLSGIPGTPGHGSPEPDRAYVLGLADMYVADERFAAAYGGVEGATFVRAALRAHLGA
ncbi:MerR family transcriptional regulator [Actinotalea sp. AC32]|nr:MerR family transcriptional regulator [Actinotalea sp. AC32]